MVMSLPPATPADSAAAPELPGATLVWPSFLARVAPAAPYILIAVVALLSRLRYAWWSYNDAYGSGDAHLMLTRALFISRGDYSPPAELGPASGIFTTPPLIPLLIAASSKLTGVAIETIPLILTPAITILALLALFDVTRRALGPGVALASTLLVALHPRFSFDSTEPDKVAYVVSFFLLALWCAYAARERRWLLIVGGLFMGLSVFSHTTGYFFVPVFLLAVLLFSRPRLNPYVITAAALPLLFVAAYVVLDDQFSRDLPRTFTATTDSFATPDAPAAAPETRVELTGAPGRGDTRFVPEQVELYWNVLRRLALGGFEDSAWRLYFDGIERQLGLFVYVLAIAGFAVAALATIRSRRMELVPLLAWMLVVTLAFAVQHPAASHGTRYPSYVTPVFVVMAAYLLVITTGALAARLAAGRYSQYGVLFALPVVAFIATDYATAPNPGIRPVYGAHHQLADYLAANDLLSDDAQLLHIGWPSTTFYLLEQQPGYAEYIHTYGWRRGSLARYTAAYLEQRDIRYFVEEHPGVPDATSTRVRAVIEEHHSFSRVARFCGPLDESARGGCDDTHVTLYELRPLPQP